MTQPLYGTENQHFKEGMELVFLVKGRILLQDDLEYIILEDPNKVRHFIESRQYDHYNIETGASIRCRIVKINCTGRIILEPCHPIYEIGSCYAFRIKTLKHKDAHHALLVSDVFNNEIELDLGNEKSYQGPDQEEIICRILDMKKGIPILQVV